MRKPFLGCTNENAPEFRIAVNCVNPWSLRQVKMTGGPTFELALAGRAGGLLALEVRRGGRPADRREGPGRVDERLVDAVALTRSAASSNGCSAQCKCSKLPSGG